MFAESNPGPAEGAARVHRVLVTQPAKTRLTEDMAAWVRWPVWQAGQKSQLQMISSDKSLL